jgi:hypothetical protein
MLNNLSLPADELILNPHSYIKPRTYSQNQRTTLTRMHPVSANVSAVVEITTCRDFVLLG